MTLTGFLDARLAEDEQRAGLGFGGAFTARALREVEAKRAILGMVMSPAQLDVERDYVLAHFAAIYEDHPDFDPQWKA